MTNQEFLQHVMTERIEMILSEQKQKGTDPESAVIDRIISTMNSNDKKQLNKWLDRLTGIEADDQRQAYLGGLKDGIYLSAMMLETILRE